MGGKPSNLNQIDRPESGGADRKDMREKSGITERDKQRFASDRAHERQDERPHGDATGDDGEAGE